MVYVHGISLGCSPSRPGRCLSACLYVAQVMARAPQHGTCPLVCVSIIPQQGVHTCLSTRGNKARKLPEYYVTQHNSAHASPLHVMGTDYQTQSQGYENTAYQAHSQSYGKLLPLVAQTPG